MTRRRRRSRSAQLLPRWLVYTIRAAIVAVFLLLWQFVPEIHGLRGVSPVFDPFFISSPTRVWHTIRELATGTGDQPLVWKYLLRTIEATLIGFTVGTIAGAVLGLVLSNSPRLSDVVRPFITMANSVPRIALVPIFVIIAGPSITGSVLTAIFVVLFIVFFNAFSGGTSVPPEALRNATLLGASRFELMWKLRARYVLVWTFAALPNAISFSLVSVVAAELFIGTVGTGQLLLLSVSSVDASLTFAIVILLSIVGVVMVGIAEAARSRLLRWWDAEHSPGA